VSRLLAALYDGYMTKLVFGCGYLGERVARRWQQAGHEVVVVTRSPTRAAEFQHSGFATVVADITQPGSLRNLPNAETVLFAVGFDRKSDVAGPTIENVYAGGVRNVLTVVHPSVERFIYISTTGVYGVGEGEWVDEITPVDPQREGGQASLAAEQTLAASPLADRSIILRLAGIYGPARVPFLDELRRGAPIPAATNGFLNLIHVDDAAEVVVAADHPNQANMSTRQVGPRVYCVSDGEPVERGAYYSEVARMIGAAPPRFVEPDPNSPRALRARNSRRVSNLRMLAELHVTLKYPDYRAGLAAIFET
jgi:nucleoside-diphosphate-sugar epimerase